MGHPTISELDNVVVKLRQLKSLSEEVAAVQEQIDCISALPSCTKTASLPGWRDKLLGKLRVKHNDAFMERESLLNSLHSSLDTLSSYSVQNLAYSSPDDYQSILGYFYKALNLSRESPVFFPDQLPVSVIQSITRIKDALQIKNID